MNKAKRKHTQKPPREQPRRVAVITPEISDPAVTLWQRWDALRQQHAELPTHAGDEEQDELCEQWSSASRALSRAPVHYASGYSRKVTAAGRRD